MELLRRLTTGVNPKGLFRCDYCGEEVEAFLYNGMKAKSCRKCSFKLRTTHASKNSDSPYEYVRRGSKTRLYSIWSGMKSRCYNPNATSYKWYGAKGVTICDEWKNSYKAFAEWAIEHGGYNPDTEHEIVLTIDRIDSSKGYEPDNARFIEAPDNIAKRNKEHSKTVHAYFKDGTYKDSYNSLGKAAEALGLSVSNLSKAVDKINATCGGLMFRTKKTDSIEPHEEVKIERKYESMPVDVYIYATDEPYGSFNNVYTFANSIDANVGHIIECINGKRRFVKGFRIEFQDNKKLSHSINSIQSSISKLDSFIYNNDVNVLERDVDRLKSLSNRLQSIIHKLRTKE